mgnify:FL=1
MEVRGTKMNKNIIISQASNLIMSNEGCVLKSYKDTRGIWTIGYGTTFIDNKPVTSGMTITQNDAANYLEEYVSVLYDTISTKLPNLTDNQMIAVLDFSYNVGLNAFLNSTMYKYLSGGKISQASGQFLLWVYSNGKKLSGLVRRRTEEKQIFDEG